MKIPNSTHIQIGVWISIYVVPMLLFSSMEKPDGFYFFIGSRVFLMALYFNLAYHVVFPRYFSGQRWWFVVLSLLTLVGYILSSVFLSVWMHTSRFREAMAFPISNLSEDRMLQFALIPAILSGMLIFGVAASARAFSAYEKKKKGEDVANRRRIEAELALLKSQINPHFLLNTLNNLNALALTAPEKTPDALQKLSELVRFILHECTQPTVLLAEDLRFIENYLALQRLRLPPNVRLRVEMPNPDTVQGSIEPMILIPFIENPFKHGLTTQRPCDIFISIQRLRNKLILQLENDLISPKNTADTAVSGMGLANTRQRLKHAFPGKHLLQIEEKEGRYRVELTLILEK